MIKNIIFDWSGVINDNLLTVHEAIMVLFERYHVPRLSLEEFKREWEQPYMSFYNRFVPELKKDDQKEEELYKKAYRAAIAKYPPGAHPHIKETLQKFKKAGIKMIVISSDPREILLSDIEEFNLQELFDEINSEVHDKTDDIQETIQRNNFNPEETVFIGDTAHEVEAGKSAGTKTAAVTWGYNNEDKLRAANPDFIAHNLEELESIILK